jgi:DNA-binding HxlR family transcriptional regulator
MCLAIGAAPAMDYTAARESLQYVMGHVMAWGPLLDSRAQTGVGFVARACSTESSAQRSPPTACGWTTPQSHTLHYIQDVSSKSKDTSKFESCSPARRAPGKISHEALRFSKVLRQIADPHALLIMRELSLNVRRFQDIQAQTKIGSHMLSSRLQRLLKDGVIERKIYSQRPARFEYFATAKGRELDEVLFAAANWNIKWDPASPEPSLLVFDKLTGERLGTIPPGRQLPPEEGLR